MHLRHETARRRRRAKRMTEPAFSHQPLGPRGGPLSVDAATLAWAAWRGVASIDLFDVLIDMAREARRRPWSVPRRIVRLRAGRIDVVQRADLRTPRIELVLRDDRASANVLLSESVKTEWGSLLVRCTVPDSYAAAMVGRTLSDVVKTPLPMAGLVESATQQGEWLHLVPANPFVPLPIEGIMRV